MVDARPYKVNKIQSLYFSPTGSTCKIVEAITKGTGLSTTEPIDITLPRQREAWNGKIDGDLMIIGVPVYASTFPAVILQSLKKLNGEDRLAVPISVCGGVYVGGCLPELSGILRKQGFIIPAAGNFIGQHAFATDSIPLSIGRPNYDDLQKATEFGRKVAEKIKNDRADITSMAFGNLYIRFYARGSLEAQGSFFPERYHQDQYVSVSEHGKERCGGCRMCEESCPTGTIDATTLQIDDKLCTRCFACTIACPTGVLQKYLNHSSELASLLRQQIRHRGEPQTFF